MGLVNYSEVGDHLSAAGLVLTRSGTIHGALPAPAQREGGLLEYPFVLRATDELRRTIEAPFKVVTAKFTSRSHFLTLLHLYGSPLDGPLWLTPQVTDGASLGVYIHKAYHEVRPRFWRSRTLLGPYRPTRLG